MSRGFYFGGVRMDKAQMKEAVSTAYHQSETLAALQSVLEQQGFVLCNGKRPFLVLHPLTDQATTLPRATGLKIKDIKAKLGDGSELPTYEKDGEA